MGVRACGDARVSRRRHHGSQGWSELRLWWWSARGLGGDGNEGGGGGRPVARVHLLAQWRRWRPSARGRLFCASCFSLQTPVGGGGMQGSMRRGGGGGVGPKSLCTKMAPSDCPNCKLHCFPQWSLWSGGMCSTMNLESCPESNPESCSCSIPSPPSSVPGFLLEALPCCERALRWLAGGQQPTKKKTADLWSENQT